MRETKTYEPKALIQGAVIAKPGMYIAIPDKKFKYCKILVKFKNQQMLIKRWLDAEVFRRFPDKWGRGTYTLGYFKWVPDELKKD